MSSSSHICHSHRHHVDIIIVKVQVVVVVVIVVVIVVIVIIIIVTFHTGSDTYQNLKKNVLRTAPVPAQLIVWLKTLWSPNFL